MMVHEISGDAEPPLLKTGPAEDAGAREALRESEGRFSKAFHASPVATSITLLEDGSFIDVNDSFLRMTAYTREEVIGRTSLELEIWGTPEERRDFINLLQQEESVRDAKRVFRTKTGETRVALLSAVIIELQGRSCLLMMIRDVTRTMENEERIRAYQGELRSLASQLSLVEERERRRIATELHDHIGQTLAMIKIKLGSLQSTIGSSASSSKLDEIRELLEETIRSTRSLSFELSPPILYDLGFEAAVEWLAEQTQEQHGIPVEFRKDINPTPLDHGLRVLLFASVRELIVNVVKHSKARMVRILIQSSSDEIHVRVEDNGIGMDASNQTIPVSKKGFGLFSIRERIGHLGGRFEIHSTPGQGTQVDLHAPLTFDR